MCFTQTCGKNNLFLIYNNSRMPAGSQEYIFLLAIVCHPGWKKVSDFQIIVSVIYSVKFKSEGEREGEGKNRTFRYKQNISEKDAYSQKVAEKIHHNNKKKHAAHYFPLHFSNGPSLLFFDNY